MKIMEVLQGMFLGAIIGVLIHLGVIGQELCRIGQAILDLMAAFIVA